MYFLSVANADSGGRRRFSHAACMCNSEWPIVIKKDQVLNSFSGIDTFYPTPREQMGVRCFACSRTTHPFMQMQLRNLVACRGIRLVWWSSTFISFHFVRSRYFLLQPVTAVWSLRAVCYALECTIWTQRYRFQLSLCSLIGSQSSQTVWTKAYRRRLLPDQWWN